jgi:hypothetical protein
VSDIKQLEQHYRFADLKALKIVDSWPQLRNLQINYGFPTGKRISPNVRIFAASEINAWLASRPDDLKIMPSTTRRPGRPRKPQPPQQAA